MTNRSFAFQVLLKEQVIEVQLMMAEFPESCYYTCFHFTCNGTRLNEYATLDQYHVFVEADGPVSLKLVEGQSLTRCKLLVRA